MAHFRVRRTLGGTPFQTGVFNPRSGEYAKFKRFLYKAEYVCFLAIFQRTFTAIRDYTHSRDIHGILLGGWLANALHNVPSMLWNQYKGHYPSNELREEMQKFPLRLAKLQAPERLVEATKRILSLENGYRELGLSEDLSDVDLAPLSELRIYLDLLYQSCLSMRVMTNYGNYVHNERNLVRRTIRSLGDLRADISGWNDKRPHTPWKDLERYWTEEANEYAETNENRATILLPIPKGLLQWSQFDEEQFRQTVVALFGESWESYWSKFVSAQG